MTVTTIDKNEAIRQTIRTEGVAHSVMLDTPVLKKLGRKIFSIYKVQAEGGASFYIRPHSDSSIIWETYVSHMYTSLLPLSRGDTVIDVGAHIGSFTIEASKNVGRNGRIVALEPESENFGLLRRNISLNRLSNVEIIKNAAGSKDETRTLNLYEPASHSFYARNDRKRRDTEEVEVRSLDSLISERGLDRVDYIKINVEGSELEVLKGAQETLARFKPKLIIDTHDFGPEQRVLRAFLGQYYGNIRFSNPLLFMTA